MLYFHCYRRSQPKKKSTASRSPAKQSRPDMKGYKSAEFVKDSDDSSEGEEEPEEKSHKKPQPAATASAVSGECLCMSRQWDDGCPLGLGLIYSRR